MPVSREPLHWVLLAIVGLAAGTIISVAISAAQVPTVCGDTVCAMQVPGARITHVTDAPRGEVGLARATLRHLRVAPDRNPPGYDRDRRFGSWRSIGGGCDVRDLVLARDLRGDVLAPGSPCEVVAGTLRGEAFRATELDIDHVVPLRLAWDTGADAWSDTRRRAFGNDQLNLRAEPLGANRSNGELGPEASPPGGDECAYAAAFTLIVDHYDLTVTDTRRVALGRLLERCPP